MKLNQHIKSIVYCASSGRLLTDHCSGAFLRDITRAALLTIVLGTAVVLATGCASTSNGVSTRLMDPVAINQEAINLKNGSWYQPPRSPAFDPDLFGS
jgi:hypothetical protein